ncbi:rho GTPase-activating protein gacF-like [Ceratitis capitata]|uniref:rho GTPase-activating protein gacF-like n=1 Tax=Ceratitis capitata TaxID=7213 RepID=UPI00061896DF|nr:rho GTPase-activating protein gacF-like [Ceratitis capitata]
MNMDIIQELREMDPQSPSTSDVTVVSATTSAKAAAAATSTCFHRSNSTHISSPSATLTSKASSSSLTSNITRTYFNTTTSVVTRKHGGLAIAIKRQDSIGAYGGNNNNNNGATTFHTPLSSRQSSYSIPNTPITPTVPTLRRGPSVRISEASTAICVGNDENAANTSGREKQERSLTCLERFRGRVLRFLAKIMGSRTPSEDGYDYYDWKLGIE